jgi:multidrug efflux pump subunit AcrB
MNRPIGIAGRIAQGSINSKLTPLLILMALMVGAFAILKTPREEEPQIIVPMLDVMVAMPRASPQEVERRVSMPLEKLLRQIPNVEYVYSISRPGSSLIIVRFEVGSNQENAIVKTYDKLYSNLDVIPPGVSKPIVKARLIDDMPILALTLWGPNYDSYRLRQIAAELKDQIKQIFRQTPGVVDVNWYVEDPQPEYDIRVDLAKAALVGVSAEEVTRTLEIALHGKSAELLHSASATEDMPINVRLSPAERSSIDQLESLKLPTAAGGQVSFGEVTTVRQETLQPSIYRKNVRRVIYVTEDLAGGEESPVYAILKMNQSLDHLRLPQGYILGRYNSVQPNQPHAIR